MNKSEITKIIEYAIEQFKCNDAELISLNVSERAVMFHIARYMREKTPNEFHVDCEYNRHLTNVKELYFLKNSLGVADSHDVYPDILIHKRNDDENNLLVVEIKKAGIETDSDRRKLEAFKKAPYSYNFAAQIILSEPDAKPAIEYKFIE
jgi:hypothetical protein